MLGHITFFFSSVLLNYFVVNFHLSQDGKQSPTEFCLSELLKFPVFIILICDIQLNDVLLFTCESVKHQS